MCLDVIFFETSFFVVLCAVMLLLEHFSVVFTAENRLTYSITSGNVGNAFEVAPDVGEIKVRGHLDYENGPRVCCAVQHVIHLCILSSFIVTCAVLFVDVPVFIPF